jgi:hypothetical protein
MLRRVPLQNLESGEGKTLINMDLREMMCEDGRQSEMAEIMTSGGFLHK